MSARHPRPDWSTTHNALDPRMTARRWSIGFLALSFIVPAVLMVYGRHHIAAEYHMRGLVIEGKAVWSGLVLVILLSLGLCLAGFVLGVRAFRRTPPPRPLTRKIELAAFAIPPLLWLLFGHALFVWVRGP